MNFIISRSSSETGLSPNWATYSDYWSSSGYLHRQVGSKIIWMDHYLLSWTKLGSVQQVVVVQDCTDSFIAALISLDEMCPISEDAEDLASLLLYWSLPFYGLRLWCDFSRGLIVLELSMLSGWERIQSFLIYLFLWEILSY